MTCAGQRRRGHLAAGHAVDGIVDKDHGDILAARRGMDGLCRADGGKVAVALIGKDDILRMHARLTPVATAGARPWAASYAVAGEIVIGHNTSSRPEATPMVRPSMPERRPNALRPPGGG